MRASLKRFVACQNGGVATTYMMFTAIWFLIVAAGVHFTTPMMTTNLVAVSAALKSHTGGFR